MRVVLATEMLRRALTARTALLVPADLDPDADGLIAASRERIAHALAGRDRIVTVLLAAPLLATAAAMLSLESNRPARPAVAVLLVLAYAIASRVEFELGTGSVVPTELAFVPMLFLLPPGAVPLAVAAGLVVGALPDLVRRRVSLGRIPVLVTSSWFAVGPALVFLLAGVRSPRWDEWPLYLAALASQFVFDFAGAAVRERLVFRVSLRSLLGVMGWVYVVDAVLAPVGLLA